LVVVGVLALLGGLAALQYHWQLQVAEADREKMRKRVEMDAHRFAEDFDREIQAIYLNLQTDSDAWKRRDYSEFNTRYDYWRSKAAYPELAAEIYFVGMAADAPVLKYDKKARSFLAAEPSARVIELQAHLKDGKDVRPAYGDLWALAVPIHDADKHFQRVVFKADPQPTAGVMRMAGATGYLAIFLDRDVVTGRLLPDLASKYFGDGEYRVSVTGDRGAPVFGSTDGSDATASLFDVSPDKFIMFAGTDSLPRTAEVRRSTVFNQRVEGVQRTESSEISNTYKIDIQSAGSRPRTSVITTLRQPEGGWTLNVQHSAGSVGAYIDSHFRRNAAIGAGVFILLGGAILGIFFSSQRARVYAQRQLDFVSSVSHEFRTPLAVICSAGDNLADGVATEARQVESYGELIKGEGKKLSAMVEQILEFAGANSGKQRFHLGDADISEIVGDAIKECGPLLRQNGYELETDIADGPIAVSADRAALSRALQNLIANAVKYGNGSRWVRVSAQNGGQSVRIVVEDKGIGISPSDLRHVFEPFYRSREVVDAQIHGNGLGLSLVKRIAEAHGGRVTADSKPGQGSVFTIELPVRKRNS
jgi:signal transduction histidine kinase